MFNDLDVMEPIRLFEKGIQKESQDQVNFGEFKFLLRDGDIISPKIEFHEPLKMIVDSFVSIVLHGAANITDGLFAYNISSIILAAHRSIENSGCPEVINYK